MSLKTRLAVVFTVMCCSLSSANALELTVWEDYTKGAGLAQAITEFTNETGIDVKVEENTYIYALQKMRLDGPVGSGPDVILLPNDQLGMAAKEGMIDPVYLTDEEKAKYPDNVIDAVSIDQIQYAIPKSIETLAIFYNKKYLSKPFDSIDSYIKYTKLEKENGRNGFVAKFDDLFYSMPMLSSYGAYVFGKNKVGAVNVNDVGLDGPEAVKAITKIKEYYDAKLIPPVINGLNGAPNLVEMFCQGRAAATILGSWDVGTAKKSRIDFATAPLPVNSEGKQMAGFLGVRGFAISHWAKDYDAAVKLAKFLTQDRYSKSRFKLTGEIPASLKLLDDPDILNDKYANAFIQQAKLAEAMPSVSEMHKFWLPFSNQLQRIFKGKIPVADGLQEVVYNVKNSYQK